MTLEQLRPLVEQARVDAEKSRRVLADLLGGEDAVDEYLAKLDERPPARSPVMRLLEQLEREVAALLSRAGA